MSDTQQERERPIRDAIDRSHRNEGQIAAHEQAIASLRAEIERLGERLQELAGSCGFGGQEGGG